MRMPDERDNPVSDPSGTAARRRFLAPLTRSGWCFTAVVVQTGVALATGVLLLLDQGQRSDINRPLRLLGLLALLLVPVVVLGVWFLVRQHQRARAVTDHAGDTLAAAEATDRIQAILTGRTLLTAFQPIRSLPSGAWIGAEALARFPGSAHASPEEWFLEAESVGLGVELEILAIETALNTAKDLPESVYVAVNVSPGACLDPRLKGVLEKSEIPRQRIVLEVTERHKVEDYAPLAAALLPLRRAGVRIAVDDVGAGFVSMRHILQLKPDMVKLDRDIIAGIDTDPGQRALSAAMAGFAAEIGVALIAEGIETPAELDTVTSLGIGAGQGYLLCPPSTRPEEWRRWPAQLPENGQT